MRSVTKSLCKLRFSSADPVARRRFSLLELIAAMAVFSIIVLVLLNLFTSAQKLWLNSACQTEMFENARIAMDLMARDIQTIMYNDSTDDPAHSIYPFWHEAPDRINIISATDSHSSSDVTNICEVKYARSDGELTKMSANANTVIPAGYLIRSVTGDYSDTAWNFSDHPLGAAETKRAWYIWKKRADGSWSSGGNGFEEVIPYVVGLQFSCLDKEGGDTETADGGDLYDFVDADYEEAPTTPLPYSIRIDLAVLDARGWNQWLAMGGDAADPANDPDEAREFREKRQRLFSRTIFLGERASEYE